MKTTVRAFRLDDIDAICAIAVKAWEGIHRGYRKYIGNDDLYNRFSRGWKKNKIAQIQQKAHDNPDGILVAECDGAVAGFVTFTVNKDTGIARICNNAVDPTHHRKGIGTSMYNAVIDFFRMNDMKYVLVSTGYEDEGHAGARAAYKKAGFEKMLTSVTYSLKL